MVLGLRAISGNSSVPYHCRISSYYSYGNSCTRQFLLLISYKIITCKPIRIDALMRRLFPTCIFITCPIANYLWFHTLGIRLQVTNFPQLKEWIMNTLPSLHEENRRTQCHDIIILLNFLQQERNYIKHLPGKQDVAKFNHDYIQKLAIMKIHDTKFFSVIFSQDQTKTYQRKNDNRLWDVFFSLCVWLDSGLYEIHQ